MLTKIIVSFCNIYMYKIILLYTLSLYVLIKLEKKKKIKKRKYCIVVIPSMTSFIFIEGIPNYSASVPFSLNSKLMI